VGFLNAGRFVARAMALDFEGRATAISRQTIPRHSLLVRARACGPVPGCGGAGSGARQTHPELRLPEGSEAASTRVPLLLVLLTARVGPHLPPLPSGS
jgi:hypothetical protein